MTRMSTQLGVLTVSPDSWSPAGRQNFDRVRRLVGDRWRADLVVLPELVGGEGAPRLYEHGVRSLAAAIGAWVVGGSSHQRAGNAVVNRGVFVSPRGDVVGEYSKRHPFDSERAAGLVAGSGPTTFDTPWGTIAIAICADFFHGELLSDLDVALVAVPAFSVTRSSRQALARVVWRCSAIARAYELGSYVAISDWTAGTGYGPLASAGVSGLADPTAEDPARLFLAASAPTAKYRADSSRTDAMSARRAASGFLARDRNRGVA